MPTVPETIQVKFDRAQAHIADLHRQFETVFHPDRYQIVGDRNSDPSHYVYRVHGLPEVPSDWSAIVGDALFNLRAVLDHLADQLVRATNGKPNKSTQFPILTKPPTDKMGQRLLPNIKPGVLPAEIRSALEAEQPYYRWHPTEVTPEAEAREHHKTLLRDLNNIDKHRNILLVATAVDHGSMWWGSDSEEAGPNLVDLNLRPLKDGDPVVTFDFGDVDPQTYNDLHAPITVRLSDPEMSGVLLVNTVFDWLEVFRGSVRMTVDQFLKYL